MVVLCSPNNPTGTFLSEADVVRVLDATEGMVVLDEAYVHFAPGSLHHLLSRYDRLVVLQTFSKAMGAAGLRFGYALAAPALARAVEQDQAPVQREHLHAHRRRGAHPPMGCRSADGSRPSCKNASACAVRSRCAAGSHCPSFGSEFSPDGSGREDAAARCSCTLRERGILIRDVSSYPMLEQGSACHDRNTRRRTQRCCSALQEVL